MALGGGLALSDRRYALARQKERTAKKVVPRTEPETAVQPSEPAVV
jgi:hypothetical protein